MSRKPRAASAPGTPRWVKVFAAIAVIVILLLGVLLVSGGSHGPGRHTGSGATDGRTAPSGDGHQPPAGAHTP